MNTPQNTFLHNFFHLSLLRTISHILPLISTPFLLRAIGVKAFGDLELCKAITMYFTACVSYGFRYSATKHISLYQEDKDQVGQIMSAVYAIQVIFIVISMLLLWGLIVCIPKINSHATYLLNFFPVAITSSLFPTFSFQGLNIMRWVVGINFLSKVLFLSSVLLFINQPADAILFPRFLAGMDLLRLLLSFLILYRYQKIPFKYPRMSIMIQQLKEGVNMFLSILSTMVYTRFPIMFLGLYVSSEAVAIYALGEKIPKVTEGMLEPAMQALYPISHFQIGKNLDQGLKYLWKFGRTSLGILVGLGVIYYVFAESIMTVLMGTDIPAAVQVFKTQAFVAAIMLVSYLLGMHVLIPLKAGYLYNAVLVITGCVAAGLHLILIPKFSIQGAAITVVLGELLTLSLLSISTYRTVKKVRLEALRKGEGV